MIEQSLSAIWSAVVPGFANHLWQSTVVALAAAVLTSALRRHSARIRYIIWLAASAKFLLPFSLLVGLGNLLAWRSAPASRSDTVFYAMEQIGQPFTRVAPHVASQPNISAASASPSHWLSWIVAVWLTGFMAVVLLWIYRWFHISTQMKSAELSSRGRELEILRRAERIGGLSSPIALLLSRASLEPGIFGIARPVLLWPEAISKHLDDAQLEAILAHEVWHVRRRDNLYAALHMLVEAVFWFYPLVWWLGSRLVEERERACDEQVVASGSDRHVYAESILKVCEFCLGSPLPCVAGVTGADLKKRMVHIMSDRILHKLDFARKLLITAAAFLAIAIPITFGLFHATPGRAQSPATASTVPATVFSSVSVKPSQPIADGMRKVRFNLKDGSALDVHGANLQHLIQMAYRLQDAQISGPSDVLSKPRFDIDAKLDPSFAAAMSQRPPEQSEFERQALLKSLLATQFKLAAHFETRNLPVYELLVDEDGSKLQEASGMQMMHMERGELNSTGAPIAFLAQQLSSRVGSMVVDKTGLKGDYAFDLRWTPDASEDQRFGQSREEVGVVMKVRGPDPNSSPSQAEKLEAEQAARAHQPDPNAPSLFVALQQQLGLKLEPQTEPVQVLVIDHVEVPSGN
ncbi:MAG TPA: M56 family metallopeptidase [Candidatus Sulfotelmatobacter sp.]|nr:M56 family metallopeptidase [Candidatus Sulfotelmatobacter sp.]